MNHTHYMQRMARAWPPAGHHVLTRDTFENFAHANHLTIDMPVGAGWATTRIGGQRFATWLDGAGAA